MAKKRRQRVKCKTCKKPVIYIPIDYEMNIPIECVPCGTGKKKAKPKATLTANYARTRKGVRPDIHPTYCFKSATEANVARIFEYLGLKWKYEERAFTYMSIYDNPKGYKTKPWVYVMDYEIFQADNGNSLFPPGFYEVKGYMDPMSRKKLLRLKLNYPEEFSRTTVILYNKYKKKDIEFCKKLGYRYLFYDELSKEFEGRIPTWE